MKVVNLPGIDVPEDARGNWVVLLNGELKAICTRWDELSRLVRGWRDLTKKGEERSFRVRYVTKYYEAVAY